MMNTGIENDIGYRLVKASDSKRDSYRAVLKHDAVSARATLDEICAATPLPRHLIESAVSGTLDTMIRRTLGDGRTRRFGNWFETRCDILGRFDRIDEEFDPARHSVAINLLTLSYNCANQTGGEPTDQHQTAADISPRECGGVEKNERPARAPRSGLDDAMRDADGRPKSITRV